MRIANVMALAGALAAAGCGLDAPKPGCLADGLVCSLRVVDEHTVADDATGLVWQRGNSPKALAWRDAAEYCGTLEVAGFADWAMPTEFELGSLVGTSARLALNDYVFTPVRDQYWSATTNGAGARALQVRGTSGKPIGLYSASPAEAKYVRCVRNPADAPMAGLESGVTQLAAGFDFACALKNDTDVLCWGRNDVGQLATGDRQPAAAPAKVKGLKAGKIRSLVAGYANACVVFTDGTAQCWGANSDGQVGDGAAGADKTKPTDVQTTGIVSLAFGGFHACAALSSGAVKCWGLGELAQLGDGTATSSATGVTPAGLTGGVKSVTAGFAHSCALLNDGTAQCWGLNRAGEIGNNTIDPVLEPVSVLGLTGAVRLWARGGLRNADNGDTVPVGSTCALKLGGTLVCWGGNDYGQMATGILASDGSADQYTPVEVAGLGGAVKAFDLGSEHACAVADQLMCWGRNDSFQLGDGTPLARTKPEPVALPAAKDAAAVAAGGAQTCVLDTRGAVRCWGR